MAKKLSEMTEQELNAHNRAIKIRRDSQALRKYAARLRKERRVYIQTFDAFSINQRRSRELALGACALKAIDAVRELWKVKPLIPGTLEYVIHEEKVKDADDRKGFHCVVTFKVTSNEDAHSPEDIQKEIEDTFEKMMRETDEMFPEEKEED